MINFFLQVQNDTIAQATGALIEGTVNTTEISVLGFILKGGFFLIPIALLLFYTFYIIIERYLYIHKRAVIDPNLIRDIRDNLNAGNIDMAVSVADRSNTASGYVLREGILTIGRPISEIESNMERAANIEVGEMEKKLGQLGLIAGVAPTFGFIGPISAATKISYSISQIEDISIGTITEGFYEKRISSGAGLVVGLMYYSAYHLYTVRFHSFTLSLQNKPL